MISQLGQIPANGPGQVSLPDSAMERDTSSGRPDAAARGERASAADAVLTALAVDAPRQADRAAALPEEAAPSLLPPDPDAPTGPPPAFEASLLDRQRELGLTFQPAEPSETAPYDAPPTPIARAEGDVASLRRLETPYDTATVDVLR